MNLPRRIPRFPAKPGVRRESGAASNSARPHPVGGGSLVYTNIQQQPPDEFFSAFPPKLSACELRPYYDRVRVDAALRTGAAAADEGRSLRSGSRPGRPRRSLYPKSPGLPPSMTIAALAERQAALMP